MTPSDRTRARPSVEFKAAAARAGHTLATAAAGVARLAARIGQEQQQRTEAAHRVGHCLGLTADATQEVIDAWTRFSGTVTDWPTVHQALTQRALGKPWRPPTMDLDTPDAASGADPRP